MSAETFTGGINVTNPNYNFSGNSINYFIENTKMTNQIQDLKIILLVPELELVLNNIKMFFCHQVYHFLMMT
jgi:hypothetical protein